jgi:hypothetical protein
MVVILPAQYLATQKFDVTRAALLRALFDLENHHEHSGDQKCDKCSLCMALTVLLDAISHAFHAHTHIQGCPIVHVSFSSAHILL